MAGPGVLVAAPGVEARGSGRPLQFRLADLALWVVGVGLASALLRPAREVWKGDQTDPYRLLGAIGIVLVVFLGLNLAQEALRMARRRAWGAAFWRLAGVATLAAFAVPESEVLSVASLGNPLAGMWSLQSERLQLVLVPTAGAVAMAGLFVALRPGRRVATEPRAVRWGWLSVALAATAGVAILAIHIIAIPYLVVLALEAVQNAMARPDLDRARLLRAPLESRMKLVALESLLALVALIWAGSWLAADLRRVDDPRRAGRRWVARGAAGAVAAAILVVLIRETLSRLHPHLSEGLWTMLGPTDLGRVVVAFTALSLGLASRAADAPPAELDSEPAPEPAPVPPRWAGWRRLAGWAVVLMLAVGVGDLILTDIVIVWSLVGMPEWAVACFAESAGLVGWVKSTVVLTLAAAPNPDLIRRFLWPETLALSLALLWTAARTVARFTRPGHPPRPLPLDRIVAHRRALALLTARAVALTLVCLAALPTFFLNAIVAFHYGLIALCG